MARTTSKYKPRRDTPKAERAVLARGRQALTGVQPHRTASPALADSVSTLGHAARPRKRIR